MQLNQLIDDGQFIGVYPNGHSNDGSSGGFWNLGTQATTADDVEFVNLIVQQLSKYPEANTSKMYALGFSNGAGMVNLLGKSTNHFKAIAPLFSQQIITTGNLTPPTTLSVFQVNGDVDPLVPVNGGKSVVGEFLSAENSALNWVSAFGCNATAVQKSITWGTTQLNSFAYSGCNANQEIQYLIAFNTGHGFTNQEVNNQLFTEIWTFFQRH